MKIDRKNITENELELTVHVSRQEAAPYLISAATRISQAREIKGFRPGKAPYEVVKRQFGEEAIISEGLEEIIDGTLNKILSDENIKPYGQMGFNLLPAEADDAVAYKTVIVTLPKVELSDWESKKIKRSEIKISEEELSNALAELAKMSATEEPVDRPAQKDDKATVDFEVKVDGKVIQGGTAQDFELTLGEGRMIPGFEDKIIGATAGQKLEFKLSFPKDYQATELAGKEADFTVTLKKLSVKVPPKIDDEFAKKLGISDLTALKDRLKENLTTEKERNEQERLEIAAIKRVTEAAKIGAIPQAMIADTVNDLMHDFEHNLAHQGMTMESYLKLTNKKLEDIRKDFEPKALDRVKTSLVMEELAIKEKLTITTTEIEEELEAQKRHFAGRPEVLEDIRKPEYRRHIANTLLNRKIIKFITSKIVE